MRSSLVRFRSLRNSSRPYPTGRIDSKSKVRRTPSSSSTSLPPPSAEGTALSHLEPRSGLPRVVDITEKVATHRTAIAVSTLWCPPSVSRLFSKTINTQERAKGAERPSSRSTSSKGSSSSSSSVSTSGWRPFEEVTFAKKGPIFATAAVAGTMAAKNCSQMIPCCHPLPLERCQLSFTMCSGRRTPEECERLNERAETSSNAPSVPHRTKKEKSGRRRTDRDGWVTIAAQCNVATSHKTGVEMEALCGATVAGLTLYDMLKGASAEVGRCAQQDGLQLGGSWVVKKTGGKSDILR